MAHHVVGYYDFDNKVIEENLFAIELESDFWREKFEKLKTKGIALVKQIQGLSEKIKQEDELERKMQKIIEEQDGALMLSSQTNTAELKALIEACSSQNMVLVADSMWKDTKNCICEYLNIDVDDDFFKFGKLKRLAVPLPFQNQHYEGSETEQSKYEKYRELKHVLFQMKLRKKYMDTFNGLFFIPLAIKNISSIADNDISINIEILNGECINPDRDLICEQLDGLQGSIVDQGLIEELFFLPEDGTIHKEPVAQNGIRYLPEPIPLWGEKKKTKEDYEEEMMDWIASEAGRGRYEYSISALRPNECKWLSPGMLIRPTSEGKVKISYHIRSSKSSGHIEGILEMGN